MKILNYTPHPVSISKVDGSILVLPSIPGKDNAPRCEEAVTKSVESNGFLLKTVEFGDVINFLPEFQPGTIIIVSAIVRSKLHCRYDLVSPGKALRDTAGNQIGAEGFIVNPGSI